MPEKSSRNDAMWIDSRTSDAFVRASNCRSGFPVRRSLSSRHSEATADGEGGTPRLLAVANASRRKATPTACEKCGLPIPAELLVGRDERQDVFHRRVALDVVRRADDIAAARACRRSPPWLRNPGARGLAPGAGAPEKLVHESPCCLRPNSCGASASGPIFFPRTLSFKPIEA